MNKIIIILFLLLSSACCQDQAMEKEVFLECVKSAQVQPHTTNFNDAAEVVEQCKNTAAQISFSTGQCK